MVSTPFVVFNPSVHPLVSTPFAVFNPSVQPLGFNTICSVQSQCSSLGFNTVCRINPLWCEHQKWSCPSGQHRKGVHTFTSHFFPAVDDESKTKPTTAP